MITRGVRLFPIIYNGPQWRYSIPAPGAAGGYAHASIITSSAVQK